MRAGFWDFLQVLVFIYYLMRGQIVSKRPSITTDSPSPGTPLSFSHSPGSPKESSGVVKTDTGERAFQFLFTQGDLGHKHSKSNTQVTLTAQAPCSTLDSVLQMDNVGGASTFTMHGNIQFQRRNRGVTLSQVVTDFIDREGKMKGSLDFSALH